MQLIKLACVLLLAHQAIAGSIRLIATNPIPSWASPRDVCNTVRSCDSCDSNAEYCKYVSAKPFCCSPPPAAITPVIDNPIPVSASTSDSCSNTRSCDSCVYGQYCRYMPSNSVNGQPQAQCCTLLDAATFGRQGENPTVATEDNDNVDWNRQAVATVRPIAESPIPSWASNNDQCSKIKSCDACNGSNQYCKYNKKGHSLCCAKTEENTDNVVPSAPASVTPIQKNPVPSWASSSDVCSTVRSCDYCESSDNSYCKYSARHGSTLTPKAQCCTRKGAATTTTTTEEETAGAILPIENPVPSWASSSDVCSTVRTCDECAVDSTRYCSYTQNGEAKCCTARKGTAFTQTTKPLTGLLELAKQAFEQVAQQINEQSETSEAGIAPITEDPIPSWASNEDVCVRKRSCDVCMSGQYCRYTRKGRATCCSRRAPAVSEEIDASILPVTVDPTPTWASESDKCTIRRSCDDCNGVANSYCKYTSLGEAQCCVANAESTPTTTTTISTTEATIAPISSNPTPSWAASSDVCLQVRSCDSCNKEGTYCKYTKKGKAQCCGPKFF